MNQLLSKNGEIDLLVNNTRFIILDELEQWQIDQLMSPLIEDSSSYSIGCLNAVDRIVTEWLNNLTKEQWIKIERQKSLFGIPLPQNWIKVWRFILKEPNLRDTDRATRHGSSIGTYQHLWNMWSQDCIEKYLNDLDKELLQMVDNGYLYVEIGDILLGKYGEQFWKPRKSTYTTTLSQVVNNYLYWKMPNKIVRAELTDITLTQIKSLKKKRAK